jgi:hypothetical protein
MLILSLAVGARPGRASENPDFVEGGQAGPSEYG